LKHIIEGFKKLYSIKIIHRDIKPANILLNQGVAKITDFGFARMIETEMNGMEIVGDSQTPLIYHDWVHHCTWPLKSLKVSPSLLSVMYGP
jgi:serine/threonine protein kinase